MSTADGKTYLSLAEHGKRLGISKQAVSKCAARNSLAPNAAGKYAHEDIVAALRAERADQDASDKTRPTAPTIRPRSSTVATFARLQPTKSNPL